jgi:Protein of unknown function (DUF3293)
MSESEKSAPEPSLVPQYHETRFRMPLDVASWPAKFALITGYATTGEVWSDARNQQANDALEKVLVATGSWMAPITGYSPITGHAEPGWAVELPFEKCCDLGAQFLQDAIYFVENGTLYVSPCAPSRRSLFPVAIFNDRLDPRVGS